MKLEVPRSIELYIGIELRAPVDGGLWDDLLLEENITLLFDIGLRTAEKKPDVVW